MSAAIRLNAGNDRNGNPRRLWIVVDKWGEIRAVADEGYRGSAAFAEATRGEDVDGEGPTFETTPKQYREIIAQAKAAGRYIG